tara:strand:+ start:684 stop:1379 length:696 start_codon:yes stop_codon:yes gene_type:complete
MILKGLRKIIRVFRKKIPMKQELLLIKALEEEGFDCKKLKLRIDHNYGLNFVNGIEFGIKYPRSFYTNAQNVVKKKKKYSFYFNGYINDNGGRKKLLELFSRLPNSKIISSNDGRIPKNKDVFNKSYFNELADSQFGLCPHQLDWQGDLNALWTYRFIECCFVNTIPVLFKKTPLSEKFIKGFNFYWDDDILNNLNLDSKKLTHMSIHNKQLASEIFLFTEEELNSIRKSL